MRISKMRALVLMGFLVMTTITLALATNPVTIKTNSPYAKTSGIV
jgi:hypothetical protein